MQEEQPIKNQLGKEGLANTDLGDNQATKAMTDKKYRSRTLLEGLRQSLEFLKSQSYLAPRFNDLIQHVTRGDVDILINPTRVKQFRRISERHIAALVSRVVQGCREEVSRPHCYLGIIR